MRINRIPNCPRPCHARERGGAGARERARGGAGAGERGRTGATELERGWAGTGERVLGSLM